LKKLISDFITFTTGQSACMHSDDTVKSVASHPVSAAVHLLAPK